MSKSSYESTREFSNYTFALKLFNASSNNNCDLYFLFLFSDICSLSKYAQSQTMHSHSRCWTRVQNHETWINTTKFNVNLKRKHDLRYWARNTMRICKCKSEHETRQLEFNITYWTLCINMCVSFIRVACCCGEAQVLTTCMDTRPSRIDTDNRGVDNGVFVPQTCC